jgi:hypothetical protein
MEEPASPQDGPHDRRSSHHEAPEVRELRAQVAAHERKLEDLGNWKDNLQGQGGVTVNDRIISFDSRVLRKTDTGDEVIIACIINGGVVDVAFKARVAG